jgi:hypothetical protein
VVKCLQDLYLILKSLLIFNFLPWDCLACSDLLRGFMLNPMNNSIGTRPKYILFVYFVDR